MSCLMVEFGEIKNLMDVLTQYEILEFYRFTSIKNLPNSNFYLYSILI